MQEATTPPIHSQVEPLSWLLGTWRGEGRGDYPTIESFSYGEEVRFAHVGKPFLSYQQRTWNQDGSGPLHTEAGYWRPQLDGSLEVTLAHPTGIVEIEEGTIDGDRIELRTSTVVGSPTAKDVTALTRTFVREGDVLRYEVWMAAVGEPLQYHLDATLRRVV